VRTKIVIVQSARGENMINIPNEEEYRVSGVRLSDFPMVGLNAMLSHYTAGYDKIKRAEARLFKERVLVAERVMELRREIMRRGDLDEPEPLYTTNDR